MDEYEREIFDDSIDELFALVDEKAKDKWWVGGYCLFEGNAKKPVKEVLILLPPAATA